MRRMDEWITGPPGGRLEASLKSGLRLASHVYGAGVEVRSWAYRKGLMHKESLGAPVVSIGNVTVGGTGKTPLTIWLARYLLNQGRTPAIVSRGYLKSGRGLVVVSDRDSILAGRRRAGDEPWLMARTLPGVPVIVGPNRALSSLVAVGRFSPDIILMDDAFQHLRVQRDLDIAVIDASDPFGNGRLLPAGLLREPPSSLVRADLIVLTRTDQTDDLDEVRDRIRMLNDHAPLIETIHRPVGITYHQDGTNIPLESLSDYPVAAFSGIGNPDAFEDTLESLGADVVHAWRFPNHHEYRRAKLSDMVDRARDTGAKALVTTEKDAVRFPAGFSFNIPLWILRVELEPVTGGEHFARLLELEPHEPVRVPRSPQRRRK